MLIKATLKYEMILIKMIVYCLCFIKFEIIILLLFSYICSNKVTSMNQNLTQSTTWPVQGACCNVSRCRESKFFTSYSGYNKHWHQRHIPTQIIYRCVQCNHVSNRAYDARRHGRSAGNKHVCVQETAVKPTFQSPGTTVKYLPPSREEMERYREGVERQRLEEEERSRQEKEERRQKDREERQRRAQNDILDNWFDRNLELDFEDDI